MPIRFTNTENVNQISKTLRHSGCKVIRNQREGTISVSDRDGKLCFWGIQNGNNRLWVVNYTTTDHIKWKDKIPNEPVADQPRDHA